jgi:predicted kinase
VFKGPAPPRELGAAMPHATMTLLIGLPESGKTTLAKQLEVERAALRLTPDEWMSPLFGAGEHQGRRWVLESELLWSVAARALQLGVKEILDYGCWSRDERKLFRKRAEQLGASTELIVLDLPLDILWQRLHARNETAPANTFHITRAELTSWNELFERPTPDELAGCTKVPVQQQQAPGTSRTPTRPCTETGSSGSRKSTSRRRAEPCPP